MEEYNWGHPFFSQKNLWVNGPTYMPHVAHKTLDMRGKSSRVLSLEMKVNRIFKKGKYPCMEPEVTTSLSLTCLGMHLC